MPTGVYQRRSAAERFAGKYVIDESGCWNWTGCLNSRGYGQFVADGRVNLAHRWSYEHNSGREILPGRVIDHLCRNPRCVNPAHLDCVTMRENTERGVLYQTLSSNAKKKTHCKRGHELFGPNLRIDGRGHRSCRTCASEHSKTWKAANRDRVNALQKLRRNASRPKAPTLDSSKQAKKGIAQ